LGLFNIRGATVGNTMHFILCLSRIYKNLIKLRRIEPIKTLIKNMNSDIIHEIIFTILVPDSHQLDKETEECYKILSDEYEFIRKTKRGKLYYKYLLTYCVIFSQNKPADIKDKESINSIFQTFHDILSMHDEFYTKSIKKLILKHIV